MCHQRLQQIIRSKTCSCVIYSLKDPKLSRLKPNESGITMNIFWNEISLTFDLNLYISKKIEYTINEIEMTQILIQNLLFMDQPGCFLLSCIVIISKHLINEQMPFLIQIAISKDVTDKKSVFCCSSWHDF